MRPAWCWGVEIELDRERLPSNRFFVGGRPSSPELVQSIVSSNTGTAEATELDRLRQHQVNSYICALTNECFRAIRQHRFQQRLKRFKDWSCNSRHWAFKIGLTDTTNGDHLRWLHPEFVRPSATRARCTTPAARSSCSNHLNVYLANWPGIPWGKTPAQHH